MKKFLSSNQKFKKSFIAPFDFYEIKSKLSRRSLFSIRNGFEKNRSPASMYH